MGAALLSAFAIAGVFLYDWRMALTTIVVCLILFVVTSIPWRGV